MAHFLDLSMSTWKHLRRFVAIASLLLLATTISSAQVKNSSTLQVHVAVKNGYLVVDRNATACNPSGTNLTLSDEFIRLSGRSSAGPNQCFPSIEKKLFADLDFVFAQLPPFYWFALSYTERQLDQTGQLNDSLTRAVRNSSGSWQDFVNQYQSWANANPDRLAIEETFSAYFNGTGNSFTNGLANTALIFEPQDADGAST